MPDLEDWNNIKSIIKDFSLLNITDLPEDLTTNENLELEITGKVRVWADIDISLINGKLLGTSKKEVAGLIDEFAGISSITATIRPIWKQSFPKDPSKIHVKTITDK